MITEIAPAKINLALHVRRRRADGYHDIETLFAFARDGDVVRVADADAPGFAITGPFETGLGAGPDNLVVQARDAFVAVFDIDRKHMITLEKNLPVASGIGGGSADAAATLRALARLHGVDVADERLRTIAMSLGADVPACLLGRTALGSGKGDELVAVDGLAGTPLLLVNPRVPVSTAAVFAGWNGIDRGPIADGGLLASALAGRNDLEVPAIVVAPVIAEVRGLLEAMPGRILARMSGSGASCFALFEDPMARDAAACEAGRRGWWTFTTVLA